MRLAIVVALVSFLKGTTASDYTESAFEKYEVSLKAKTAVKASWFEKTSWEALGKESNENFAGTKSKLGTVPFEQGGIRSFDDSDEPSSPTSQSQSQDQEANGLSIENLREKFRNATSVNLESVIVGDAEDEEEDHRKGENRRNIQLSSYFAPLLPTEISTPPLEPLRIKFVTNDLENMLDGSSRDVQINFLLEAVLPATQQFYSELLTVKPYQNSILIPPDVCFNSFEDVPQEIVDNGVQDADIVLFIKGIRCARPIAGASTCSLSRFDYRPIIGIVVFCLDSPAFSPSQNRGNTASSPAVHNAIHEIAHVLGMNSDLLPFFMDPTTGDPYKSDISSQTPEMVECVDGSIREVLKPSEKVMQQGKTSGGATYFEIVTPTVATVTRNQFDCQTLSGARLENQPTSFDCFGSHWDERLFLNEAMSAIYDDNSAFSSVTLALLEDSGWYRGNYSMTVKSTFGHGAGCDFVNEDCIVNGGDLPSHSKGFFCNSVSSYSQSPEYQCTPTHSSIGYCDLFDIYKERIGSSNLPPSDFRYFNDTMITPIAHIKADYCPITIQYRNFNCKVDQMGNMFEDALCLNLKLFDKPIAQCSSFVCNEPLQKLQIVAPFSDIIFTCDHDFQLHDHPDYDEVQIECPRLAVICPQFICPDNCGGKGICDYSASPARCNCFDENTNSSNCGEN